MRLLEKLFNKKLRSKDRESEEDERGKFMPPPETPVDDKFILNFKENGGKFLYCLDQNDVLSTFGEILKENRWNSEVCCFDGDLEKMFSEFPLNFTTSVEAPFCLLPCENLIANTGAILLSSNQIGVRKYRQLPYNFVVFAYTSQLVETLGEGLRQIKMQYQDLPTNITTLKSFAQNSGDEGHFLNYGSISKNLYLLLLEDL